MTIPAGLVALLACFLAVPVSAAAPAAPNRWVELRKDPVGARPGSALRYAPGAGVFLLWGWMNADPELLQEQPLMETPEYDIVAFDLDAGVWRNHFPKAWEALWSKKLPLAYNPGTYAGKTSGSERIVLRGATDEPEGVPRPDLNLVFDQVAYYPPGKSLFYFTGGLTAVYDVIARRWSDLKPQRSPPPVMGGTLAYDPVHEEMILFGGGHVAEPDSSGKLVGYTGTWAYSFRDGNWRPVATGTQPPPRMNTRMVYDANRQTFVLFGGDAQSEYLGDTWLFDLRTRRWRKSAAPAAPPARAGHFTVYDPQTGWVIVGGGYNRSDLVDMWAYHAGQDRWRRLVGEVPTGFYITADINPGQHTILLATSTRAAGDRMSCNILYPVRTTYTYRIDATNIAHSDQTAGPPAPISKRPPEEWIRAAVPDPTRRKAQEARLKSMPVNQWVYLADPGRIAPDRTWGSATFDSDRGRILYWGGEHCGYEGSDVDSYDVGLHTWLGTPSPEYPERAWDHGYSKDSSMGMCGVTFRGNPWNIHARRIYQYDPVSRKMIVVRPIRLTTGYLPVSLRDFPGEPRAHEDAIVNPPGSYDKWVTWSFDPDTMQWELLGPAPANLDTLVTTKHGVIGVVADWPWRLNDAGYQKPWNPSLPAQDTAVYRFDAAAKHWTRLGSPQTSPQNLYEGTSLAYDSTRDRVILHGGGKRRDEVWSFDLKTNRWQKLRGEVAGGGEPPVCSREAVYLPEEDVFLTFNSSRTTPTSMPLWAFRPAEDRWQRVDIGPPSAAGRTSWNGQNRAMAYDPERGLVLLVLGTGGSEGKTHVFALKYR